MRDLSRLLNPKSIALIGGAWSENVLEQLQKSGFAGDIWPVHPKRSEIRGVHCYPSLAELPSAPDVAFVGVNRTLTVDMIAELSNMGAGGATCFASGFLESETETSGGADLQARLVEAAGDMPILGPNCYGILNYLDNLTLWPDQHGGRQCSSGVAIIGQSSNILVNITMQKRSLPIAYAIAVGNQAQTGFSALASQLLDDERVTAIGLYIEGFGDLTAFEDFAAKARKAGKPIVAIKSGKSEKSRMATLSHTASLAGSAAAASAFLKRLGIVEVGSVETFLEALKLLHKFGPLTGNAISSVSCSGGEAGLVSDLAEHTNIVFRELTPATNGKLKDILGPIVTIANPLDYHTFIWGNGGAMTATFRTVFDDGFDLNLVVMDVPPTERCDMSAWHIPLQSVINAAKASKSNVALLATLPENLSEEVSDRLLENGVLPLHGMSASIDAINSILKAHPAHLSEAPLPALLARPSASEPIVLSEAAGKERLSQNGVRFPTSCTAQTTADAAKNSETLNYPVVLKGLGIAHKTEAGAVALNLNSASEVEAATNAMVGVSGFLIEEMVMDPVAEILIGVTRDETGLFVLTIGAGGTLTELLVDSASLIIPANRQQITKAIGNLKIGKLLSGYRGKPPANINAIVETVIKVQDYVIQNPNTLEIDINPLLALEQDAIAVDALIIEEKKL